MGAAERPGFLRASQPNQELQCVWRTVISRPLFREARLEYYIGDEAGYG